MIGKDLQKQAVRHTSVNDVDFVDAGLDGLNAALNLRNHAAYDFSVRDHGVNLFMREYRQNLFTVGAMASGGDNEAVAETVQYAVMIVATLPILLVYPFLQKYFVKGVMVGAVKG